MSQSELKGQSTEGDVAIQCEAPGCHFWGRTSTQNRCSKHFKEIQNSHANEGGNLEIEEENSPPEVLSQESPVVFDHPTKDIAASDDDVREEIRELQETTVPVPPTQEPISEGKPKRVQKNPKKCMECSKFVGFLGNKCKCGFVYCTKHRYPESHNCGFDFDELAREKYAQNKFEAAVSDKISGERL